MKQLPPNVQAYKKVGPFSEGHIPAGLLKDHRTLPGVWGKIVVLEGSLTYVIQSDPPEEMTLTKENFGVVEPQVPHCVKLEGKVSFYVEFYK